MSYEDLLANYNSAYVFFVIAGLIWIACFKYLQRRESHKMIADKKLPEGMRWKSHRHNLCIQVDVNYNNGSPQWKTLVDVMDYRDSHGFMEKEDVVNNMYQGLLDTDGFTKAPAFPAKSGRWKVKHHIGERNAIVNGLTIPAGVIGDYRDTIVAMVMTIPFLGHQPRILGNQPRIAGNQPRMTAQQKEQQERLGNILVNKR